MAGVWGVVYRLLRGLFHFREPMMLRYLVIMLSGIGSSAIIDANEGQAISSSACTECPEMLPVSIDLEGHSKDLMVSKYELSWNEYFYSIDQAQCPPPRNIDDSLIDLKRKDLRDSFPMTSIKPVELSCYLDWVRKKSGKAYRLPSEAEWIAIAQKATHRSTILVDDLKPNQGYLLNRLHNDWRATSGDPRGAVENMLVWRVGQFGPDALGLFDLFGNAAEATSDTVKFLSYKKENGKRPLVDQTIVKGGSLSSPGNFDLINGKDKYFSFANSDIVGFRLVYDAVP